MAPIHALQSIGHTIAHPIDSLAEDPFGTLQTWRGIAEPAFHAPEIAAASGGAARAAGSGLPDFLSGINPLEHPLKAIPDVFSYGKNIVQGAKSGLKALDLRRYAEQSGRTPPAWTSLASSGPAPPPEATAIPGTLPSGRMPGGIQNQVTPLDTSTGETLTPLPNGEFRNPVQPISPEGGPMPTNASAQPMGAEEMNRELHAMVQQLDLPGSPPGQKPTGMLTKSAKDAFGQDYADIYARAKSGSAEDLTKMDKLRNWIYKNRTWPTAKDLH
jgi:hypothetical protein